MPKFKIEISDQHLTRLQAVVARYNQNNGLELTVEEWILRNLKDTCIEPELAAFVEQNKEKWQQAVAQTQRKAVDTKLEELRNAL